MKELLPKQENAIYFLKDNLTTELLYGGAAGGGKSAIGCAWLIECADKYPGTRWLMARNVLKDLKDSTLNTFRDQLHDFGMNDKFTINEFKGKITHKNGSEIVLAELFYKPSDKDFKRLGSKEYTGAFIDEVHEITFMAWQVVKSRIRYKLNVYDIDGEKTSEMKCILYDENGEPQRWINSKGEETEGLIGKVFGSCNPSKSWPYKYFYLPNKNGDLPEHRAFVKALPKDNKYLAKNYIKSLEELIDENLKQRLLYGNWEYDDDNSALIKYESIMNYWNGKHIQRNMNDMFLTIDVARKGKDKTVFRVWAGWVCIARFEMAVSKVDEVVEKARKIQIKYGIKNSKTVADEDGVGGGVVDYLGCRGFVNNSSPLNGENYDNLKSQCSITMAIKIDKGEVVEECNSSNVIDITTEEMEQVKLKDMDKDGKMGIIPKDKVKAAIGRSPDEWDSIMMRMLFEVEPSIWIK